MLAAQRAVDRGADRLDAVRQRQHRRSASRTTLRSSPINTRIPLCCGSAAIEDHQGQGGDTDRKTVQEQLGHTSIVLGADSPRRPGAPRKTRNGTLLARRWRRPCSSAASCADIARSSTASGTCEASLTRPSSLAQLIRPSRWAGAAADDQLGGQRHGGVDILAAREAQQRRGADALLADGLLRRRVTTQQRVSQPSG